MEQLVEVFKTNVQNKEQAQSLVRHIHAEFSGSRVNFDLDDCDRILRFQSSLGTIPTEQLIEIMRAAGFQAELLSDEIPPYIGSGIVMSAT